MNVDRQGNFSFTAVGIIILLLLIEYMSIIYINRIELSPMEEVDNIAASVQAELRYQSGISVMNALLRTPDYESTKRWELNTTGRLDDETNKDFATFIEESYPKRYGGAIVSVRDYNIRIIDSSDESVFINGYANIIIKMSNTYNVPLSLNNIIYVDDYLILLNEGDEWV